MHDTNHVTSVYHRWQDQESSLSSVDTAVWETTRASILQRLDQGPMLVPAGSASRMAAMWQAFNQQTHDDENLVRLSVELADRNAVANSYKDQLDEIRTSTFWRATLPGRKAVMALRAARRRLRP